MIPTQSSINLLNIEGYKQNTYSHSIQKYTIGLIHTFTYVTETIQSKTLSFSYQLVEKTVFPKNMGRKDSLSYTQGSKRQSFLYEMVEKTFLIK